MKTNRWFVVLSYLLSVLSIVHVQAQQSPSDGPLGFQKRHGDEIMVCGQLYRIGTPVKLWLDPGGFDAYRTTRHFSPFEKRDWKSTVEEMQAGKINFVTKPQETSPDRYGLRFGSQAQTLYTPQELEQLRSGGWTLEMLQDRVDQFVLHFDVCGTSSQCFFILHDIRGLSVHFMLDADGTIYQTLDLKERAWHATKSNDRSIGIEIANIGAYRQNENNPLDQWYAKDEQGPYLIFPPKIRGVDRFAGRKLRPRRPEIVTGKVGDTTYVQYDYTPEQYAALSKLTAALSDIFPKIQLEVPRMPDGKLLGQTLTDEQWASFSGLMGHYHVQGNKSDPGPALDWEYLLEQARAYKAQIRQAR
ncbi:MAG: N-acetylmuramoyl-L-alanine amidase [Planctomycetaceae bacterium]|jgi:N-acetylmuramoyl-L-alanine amidase|nr:N-acetylmuramoyl-L-alanine amidase [Planctomycetaceae bacterium]